MKMSLKLLGKINTQDSITLEQYYSARKKRRMLAERLKIMDQILSKPVEKDGVYLPK